VGCRSPLRSSLVLESKGGVRGCLAGNARDIIGADGSVARDAGCRRPIGVIWITECGDQRLPYRSVHWDV